MSPTLPAQPNTLQPNTVLPNTVQPNTPAPNVAPVPNQALPAIPQTNSGIAAWVASLTPAEKAAEIAQLQGDDNSLVNGVAADQANNPTPFAADPTLGSLSPEQQQALLKALQAGDPAKVQSLLTPQQLASKDGQGILQVAQMEQVLQPLLNKANNGALTTTDTANASSSLSNTALSVANTVNGSPVAVSQSALQTAIQPTMSQLYTNSQLIAALKAGGPAQGAVAAQPTAAGGKNPQVPRGDHVRIALVPGMDRGAIVPLPGMVMVGVGSDGDDPGAVTLGDGNVALAAGFPVGTAPPAPDAAADASCTAIRLINAASSDVHYSANGNPFSMAPTFEQTLDGGQTWIVEFDRGGGAGTARYSLAAGTYNFKQSDKGWELYQQSYNVTLDNRDNKIDFHYVQLNKRETLPAGQTLELTGTCPPVVRFDNSAGQIKQKRLESGDYRVALADDGTLDLFPAAGVISPAAAPPAPPVPPLAPPPPAVGSGEKVVILAAKPVLAAKPLLPTLGIGEKAVGAAKPLPPHFKILDPLASILTQAKSLPSETKADAKN